jgi:hypothetical protein
MPAHRQKRSVLHSCNYFLHGWPDDHVPGADLIVFYIDVTDFSKTCCRWKPKNAWARAALNSTVRRRAVPVGTPQVLPIGVSALLVGVFDLARDESLIATDAGRIGGLARGEGDDQVLPSTGLATGGRLVSVKRM